MKKKIAAIIIAGTMLAVSGCGSTGAESHAASTAESAASESTAAESVASESTGSEAESTESATAVGDIALDDAPVSENDFTAETADDFITLAAYDSFNPFAPDGTEVKMGDTVNIDYIGYADLDGDGEVEPFDGGNTQGMGTNLEIGSASYIDDFEEQLIGHKKGDQVEVNVTFPEQYGSEELAGKDARFDVTINEIVIESADKYFSEVCNNSVVKAYPKNLWDEIVAYFESYYVRSRAKILLTAHAILAKEGRGTDSAEYQNMQSEFLNYYGLTSVEDAFEKGMTELELDYTVTYNLALTTLEEMAKE